MKKVFVNFTNHPSVCWGQKQREEAEKYGEIVDLPFPAVSALATEAEIFKMSEGYVDKITELAPAAVLCQGEFCMAYQVISALKQKGIVVLAACSERCVKETDNKKEVWFVFEQFRKY